MTLKELSRIIESIKENNTDWEELEVVIPNNDTSVGGMSVTNVKVAGRGFDWDHHKFILFPKTGMINFEF